MKPRIFLTGSTGFIGSHIAKLLARANYPLTLLIREKSSKRYIEDILDRENITVIGGDIRNGESVTKSVKGCDMIVHCAAKVGDWGNYKDFYETNVKGTRNIIESARKNNIKQIILISSNVVLGEEDCRRPKSENGPYKPILNYFLNNIFPSAMNHYRYTKMLAERESIESCTKNKLNLTVIRPVWVYGPNELHAGHYYFAKSVMEGNRFFPASRNTLFHTVYVKDLAKIIVKLAKRKSQGIQIFNVGSTKVSTLTDFWEETCKQLDKNKPIYLPKFILYPIGFIMELVYTIFGCKHAPLLTRARVGMGYSSNIYDTNKIKRIINIRETDMSKGIKETIRWWKSNEYL